MTLRITKLPDVGEGVAEAELVAWHVAVGDAVTSDTVVAEVLTDKATVEIYAPVAGTVASLHGSPGDVLAVGSELIAIETGEGTGERADISERPGAGERPETTAVVEIAEHPVAPAALADLDDVRTATPTSDGTVAPPRATDAQVLAAPAVRERAHALGIDLALVPASGPDGRITHADLDRLLTSGTGARSPESAVRPTSRTPIIGMRRKIAEQVTLSASRIPHITYVDEVDMTQLERLRASLAATHPDQPRLTVLPFVMRAIVLAVDEQPQLNATFDDDAATLTTWGPVHIGIATQTPDGLVVPVVRDVHDMDVWQIAAELTRVTSAARSGTAVRAELSGSTISITSLGALGGLVTTPIINRPEVAIVGINKMQVRPMWDGSTFAPRTMMNLSSSFDHRIVDGWDAATFVQRLRVLLEDPGLLFVPAPPGARLPQGPAT